MNNLEKQDSTRVIQITGQPTGIGENTDVTGLAEGQTGSEHHTDSK
jgi:hypothetical protein